MINSNMRVKVIKEIKGLVPGDILYYNDKDDMYEINKTDYDISDNKESVESIKYSISSYTVEEQKDYFVFIDDEDNELKIEKIYYNDFPEDENSTTNKTVEPIKEVQPETKNEAVEVNEISKLQEQIKELEKKLQDIEGPVMKYYTPSYYSINPFRHFWYI